MNVSRRNLLLLAPALVFPFGLGAAEKKLPLPGKVFEVAGRTAFLILPEKEAITAGQPIPWVWYAPTLARLPGPEETWMIERFLAAGIAIAGIDVGESYGSPAGREQYSALHKTLTSEYGLAPKAILLARSRGGLMLYSWAADHPDKVAGIAGVYPVCNIASYPGVKRAAGAYGLDEAGLNAVLKDHNPIDRLASLAKAKVPIYHVHGDKDRVVPLELNSGLLAERYKALGGEITLELIKDGGHDMKRHWFESQGLVDFVLKQAGRTGQTGK